MNAHLRQALVVTVALVVLWTSLFLLRSTLNSAAGTVPPPTLGEQPVIADLPKPKNKTAKGHYDVVIVGAGMTGAVAARVLADTHGWRVRVVDKRDHIAGNCFDKLSFVSSVMTHVYGAHLFHTNDRAVFDFLARFTTWMPYQHRVLANISNTLVPMPPTRDSVNRVFGTDLRNRSDLEAWLEKQRLSCHSNQTGRQRTIEDELLETVGEGITTAFYRHYTEKQWGLPLRLIPPATVKRVFPAVRTETDDTRYFLGQAHQAMPSLGYTAMFSNMLQHPNITVELNTHWVYPNGVALSTATHETSFDKLSGRMDYEDYDHLVYTGPIDEFFEYQLGHLPYRSLRFESRDLMGVKWYQPACVVNYPDNETQWTRILEMKHATSSPAAGEANPNTHIVREFPSATGEPYYPVGTEESMKVLAKYHQYMKDHLLWTTKHRVMLAGRLGDYMYYNMDDAVRRGFEVAKQLADPTLLSRPAPPHPPPHTPAPCLKKQT